MKNLFYFLSLSLLLSLSADLHGQLTSSIAPVTTTGDATDYAYDAQTVKTPNRELSKRERQRFQRSLARRGDDLAQWDNELETREMALNGRGARGRVALSRNPLPARLLNSEDLYAWETRLDRRAQRLRAKDLLLQEREIRLLRSRRYRDRDNHNSGHQHGHDSTHNADRCVEACCNKDRN